MPRQPRSHIVVPDLPHHIIVRGNNRRRLFSYDHERRFFLKRLHQSSARHEVPVHCSTLMNNHVHLMATPSDHEQLAAFMSGYLQPYAQFRNRRRGASGKLFEQRFKSIPIRTETQLAATMAYIELNPVRAGLCVHPEDYRWSTYRVHAAHSGVEAVIEELWSPSGWYLALGFTMFERACFYREWVSECHRRDEWDGVVAEPRLPGDRKRFERPDRSQAI